MAHEIDGPIAAVCEELRVLARARSPLGVTPGSLPALEGLAATGIGEGDLDAVHRLIDRARATLPRREAGAVALLFADDDERWQRNLTERMTLAGAELGYRYDTFRRRSGTDGHDSHYDVLLALLAEALIEVAIDDSIGDDASTASAVAGDGRSRGEQPAGPADATIRSEAEAEAAAEAEDDHGPEAHRAAAPRATDSVAGGARSRIVAAGLAAAVVAAIVVGLFLAFGPDDDDDDMPEPAADAAAGGSEGASVTADAEAGVVGDSSADGGAEPPDRTLDALESVPVEGCDVPLGGAMNPVALPEGLEALIADAFADTGGLDALGCPLRTVEAWGRLWYQEFVGGELPAGRILVDPVGDVAVWVDEVMYFHYERSGGGDLQSLGGLPVGSDYESPHPLLLLSGGGAMVAHYLGGPAHWVPVEAIEVWNDLGGADGPLGLPMADVNFFDGRPGQEWSGGYGERREDGTVAVELVDAVEITAAVAALARRTDGILRLYDETAYWIDDQGRRRWIPDGFTWICLGGASALIEPETPGWVVGAFPPGPNATCP